MTDTVGIDVGGSYIKALRRDGAGFIEDRRSVPLPRSREGVVAALEDMVAGLRTVATAAVGVGVAGLVKWPAGEFLWGPHLPWGQLVIGAALENELGLAVVVDNDANCAARAEFGTGATASSQSGVLVAIGTGIGGGLVIDGRIYRGRSFAGEFGHLTLIADGEVCACGRRGCWETLVSDARIQPWLEEARQGDPASVSALTEIGRWLGRGLAVLVATLDPEVIVVGGGAIEGAAEFLLPAARTELAASVHGAAYRRPTEVRTAVNGVWAGALGASLLAAEVASQGSSLA